MSHTTAFPRENGASLKLARHVHDGSPVSGVWIATEHPCAYTGDMKRRWIIIHPEELEALRDFVDDTISANDRAKKRNG